MVRPGWDQGPQPGGNHSSFLKILLDFHVQTSQVYLKIIFANLFLLSFWLHWVFVAARALSLVAVSGCYSAVVVWELLIGEGGLLWLQSAGCRAGRLRSRSQVWLARGLWDCPRAGIELMSPALAAGLLTTESCSVMSSCLWPHGLYSPWTSPGQNTGVGSLSLLQGIFPTQGWNPGLLHCRKSHQRTRNQWTNMESHFFLFFPPFLYENLKVSRDASFFFFFFFRGCILLIEGGHAVFILKWYSLDKIVPRGERGNLLLQPWSRTD